MGLGRPVAYRKPSGQKSSGHPESLGVREEGQGDGGTIWMPI